MKFLNRVFVLGLVAVLFIAATVAAIKFSTESSYLSRHHGIYLAYLGTSLVVLSLTYSFRKYGWLQSGQLGKWLNVHIILGSAGLLLVLAHGRLEFQALVPVFSTVAMMFVGLTGLFGWYMYLTKVNDLLSEIKSMEEAEELFLAKMASSAFRFWRFVHILATYIAVFFTFVHGISLIVFRGQF